MSEEKKLPRGHAYARFRTDGRTFHIDCPEVKVDWIAELISEAVKRLMEEERVAIKKGKDGG